MGGAISVPSLDNNVQLVMIETSGGSTHQLKSQNGNIIQSISFISAGYSSKFYYNSQIAGYEYSTGSTVTMEQVTTFGLVIECNAFDGNNYYIQMDHFPAPTQIYPQLPASSKFQVKSNYENVMIEDMYIKPGYGSILYWLWYQPISQPDTFATISFGFKCSTVPN